MQVHAFIHENKLVAPRHSAGLDCHRAVWGSQFTVEYDFHYDSDRLVTHAAKISYLLSNVRKIVSLWLSFGID